jgi:hypothetical protein
MQRNLSLSIQEIVATPQEGIVQKVHFFHRIVFLGSPQTKQERLWRLQGKKLSK